MDYKATEHLSYEGWDVCTCYDYTDLSTDDIDSWRSYRTVLLVAWSMGVWAAEAIAAKEKLYIDGAVAINGTPYPVHDDYGIPSKIAWATHDGLDADSLDKFYRRTFGGAELHKKMSDALPETRDIDNLREQLYKIYNDKCGDGHIKWDMAVVSENDKIFPVGNLRKYWEKKCRINLIKAPHYPFHLIERWEDVANGW